MSRQDSRKQGVRSEDQKLDRARQGYEPLPVSNPVAGAFGEPGPDRESDHDMALNQNVKKNKKDRSENE